MVWSIVVKALDDGCLTNEEIAALFAVPLFTEESARIIAASRRKAEQACSGLAEIHAQVGLNVARCPSTAGSVRLPPATTCSSRNPN